MPTEINNVVKTKKYICIYSQFIFDRSFNKNFIGEQQPFQMVSYEQCSIPLKANKNLIATLNLN